MGDQAQQVLHIADQYQINQESQICNSKVTLEL